MSRMAELSADVQKVAQIHAIRPVDLVIVEREVHDLLQAYPEIGEDEQLRADMIEGSTSISGLLEVLLTAERDASMMQAAMALRIKELDERQERYRRRQEGAKKMMQRLMDIAGLKRLVLTEATLSLANTPPAVQIVDETQLPEKYFRVRREPNKTAIKEDLKNNVTVPGAFLGNGGVSLRIL